MSTFDTEGNALVDHGNGLYTLDGSLRYNFVPPAIARFPCRMAIVKLQSGGLLVWSPFPPTEHVLSQVASLQEPVQFVVAPNSLHWLGAVGFANACPGQPLLCAAPGLPHKPEVIRHMEAMDRKWDAILPHDLPQGWPSLEIDIQHIAGIPLIEEVVLYHRPSQTLLAAELAFCFRRGHAQLDASWPMTWYLRLASGYRPCCLTRTFYYLLDDPRAAIAAVERILADWKIRRFIPAHGQMVTENAMEQLRQGTLDLFYEIQNHRQQQQQTSGRSGLYWLASGAAMVALAAALHVAVGSPRTRRLQR